MASDIKCDSSVEDYFNLIKLHYMFQYVIFGFSKQKNSIVLIETGELGTSYKDFCAHIFQKYTEDFCYALFDYNGTLALISWFPETMNDTSRLNMAYSKSEIAKTIVGVNVKIEAYREDEIDESIIKEKNSSKIMSKQFLKQTFELFKKNFQLNIKSAKHNCELMEFEMLNTPVIFQNTIHRLIVNEVASVALDKFYFYCNTSVMEDSELQSRLELVTLDVDPDCLKLHTGELPNNEENIDEFNEESNLLFELVIKHREKDHNFDGKNKEITGPAIVKLIKEFELNAGMAVYGHDIKWRPIGNQAKKFSDVKAEPETLLVRLLPDQKLNIKAVAIKGYGHQHLKFKPTCSAYGRRASKLELKAEIKDEDAKLLQGLFPKGVIEIKNQKAVIGNTLLIKRYHEDYNNIENLKGRVDIFLDEDHYIWEIETLRPWNQPPNKIFISAFDAMIEKCSFYIDYLEKLEAVSKDDRTGLANTESLTKELFGKQCYIDIVRSMEKPDYHSFYFIGETTTLCASLSYVIVHKFGEEVMSSYSELPNGIDVTLEIIGNNKSETQSIEIMKASLMELSYYFDHMKTVFIEKYNDFVHAHVE